MHGGSTREDSCRRARKAYFMCWIRKRTREMDVVTYIGLPTRFFPLAGPTCVPGLRSPRRVSIMLNRSLLAPLVAGRQLPKRRSICFAKKSETRVFSYATLGVSRPALRREMHMRASVLASCPPEP